ncbi:hypothetical protein, conserved [Eimeria brunetti]|uniref:AB hydrolase-1 domain-containing protein n=1 Tax=Eimeria brunetti TaxID=51314 RepID=U6LYW6_9EIME|nr:hypothetical protein, conserved [Eimeria brunetti]
MPRLAGLPTPLVAALLAILVGVVVVSGVLWLFQEKLLFLNTFPFGHKTPNLNPRGIRSPAERGIPFKDVSITTRDGHKLHGWLLLDEKPLEAPTFIFFHGNAGNIGFHLPHADFICAELGANVLLFDYRGYGHSEGIPTEEGLYTDADAALDYVLSSSLVNKENIFAFGHSLGGAVAIDLAHRRGKELRGLVVENTFTSLRDAIHDVFPPSRKFDWLLNAIQRMKLSSEKKVRKIEIPALFISSREDVLIPPYRMDHLYNACGSSRKWKLDILRGDHNSTWEVAAIPYADNFKKFIEAAISSPEPARISKGGSVGKTDGETPRGIGTGAEPEHSEAALAGASSPTEPEGIENLAESCQGPLKRYPWLLSGLNIHTIMLALLVLVLLVRRSINSPAGARHIGSKTQAHSSQLDKPGLEFDVSDTNEATRRPLPSLNDDFKHETQTPVLTPVELAVEEPEAADANSSTS